MNTDRLTTTAATVMRLVIPAAIVVVLVAAVAEFTRLPLDDVNALRITAAAGLVRGYSMYALPGGGPITEYLYPPFSAFLFAPAGLAGSPTLVIALGGLLTIVSFWGPALWLHARAGTSPWQAGAAVVFALLVMQDIGLRYTAFNIHVEAPAAGLAALAIRTLLPSARGPYLLASALCAVLAVWTKQTLAPLALALPLYVAATYGRKAFWRWILLAAIAGAVVSATMIAIFGWRELLFTVVTVPGGHPFYLEAQRGRLSVIASSAELLWTAVDLPGAIVAVLIMTTRHSASGWRPWLRENRWVGLAAVGLAMVPTSILGAAKFLAFLSAHTPTIYFIAAAASTGLAEVASRTGRARAAAAWALVVLAVVMGVRVTRTVWPRLDTVLAQTKSFGENAHEQAFAFARAHPGEVYFPRNPLATLLAEGRLDHSEWGVLDWDWAGHPPSPSDIRAHVPPRMKWIAYRTWGGDPNFAVPEPIARFPEFSHRVTLPELPGWTVYERPPVDG